MVKRRASFFSLRLKKNKGHTWIRAIPIILNNWGTLAERIKLTERKRWNCNCKGKVQHVKETRLVCFDSYKLDSINKFSVFFAESNSKF